MNRILQIDPPIVLCDESYYLLNELLEESFGIHFPMSRRKLLESRLQPRIKALHLTSTMDYYILVQGAGPELQELAHAVTNNETYLFRERYQFEALFNDGIELLQSTAGDSGRLRMLCAGCSSGEEPYTLNCFAQDHKHRDSTLRTEIDAFDLDHNRLDIAKRAQCRTRSLREMSPDQIGQYLTCLAPDSYEVKGAYRRGVAFQSGNIVDLRTYQRPMPYDVVFCRNVLIYFSDAALLRAIENFSNVLRPGGLLFLGYSESIIGLSPKFETVRLNKCIAYRRIAP